MPVEMAEIKRRMDEGIAGVMPATWDGHGRLALSEYDFSDEQREFAETLFGRMAQKYPDVDKTALAEKVAQKTKERVN